MLLNKCKKNILSYTSDDDNLNDQCYSKTSIRFLEIRRKRSVYLSNLSHLSLLHVSN